MNENRINELIEKNFSEDLARPEILNLKVNIDGVDLSVHDLMKSCYRKGLEYNCEAEIRKLYKFSYEPKFESDGLLGSYYIVVHRFADKPELCHWNGSILKNQEGISIMEREVIGAIEKSCQLFQNGFPLLSSLTVRSKSRHSRQNLGKSRSGLLNIAVAKCVFNVLVSRIAVQVFRFNNKIELLDFLFVDKRSPVLVNRAGWS